ncbi:MAG TPA: outer membrane beta-barrel protein [Aequorivita sp.]|nr:outer membrane beta-barrel protein [Aequorivita sp.]
MKTIKRISTAAFLLASALMFNVQAQTQAQISEPSRFNLSVGPEIGLPVGDLSDRYEWSLGGSVELEYLFDNGLGITLNTGVYNLFADDGGYKLDGKKYTDDLQVLPVKLGLKYFVIGGLYIQGEAGASFLLNKEDGGYDKSTAFTYAPQVGYRFDMGNNQFIDAGVKWMGSTKFNDNGSSNNMLGLRLAYGFGF